MEGNKNMSYNEALEKLKELAHEAGLGIKTFCLVYLNCLTVPEAIEKLRGVK
jgi:uncharacterized Fe-S cluster-containing MiaB family protein